MWASILHLIGNGGKVITLDVTRPDHGLLEVDGFVAEGALRLAARALVGGCEIARVLDEAHKVEIRQAVEELFDVTVTDVRIVKVQPKPKRRGRSAGTRPGWKKAIVELQPGDSIDIFEGA
jgi:ribosomal protein L23